ncbi:prostaglandin reductase-3-like [Dermacentor andersoni]|uniref:prostaglandin reductase-3-like n=1 Tax=Dermacentor andersoni TaxID=34620 RepID=UPI002155ED60|nr:prostaglandin reductase-3-like [Dermacentor andersoni]
MAPKPLPAEYRKLVCVTTAPKFRDAVAIVTVSMPKPGPDEVLVKTHLAGVNASDVDATSGRYGQASKEFPFDLGFESVGRVVAVGENVDELQVGAPVATTSFLKGGAFAEYQCLPAEQAYRLPKLDQQALPLLVSGLTAAIGLDQQGRISAGETVVITAAAGGLGHMAVQYALAAGCRVVATCSSDDKLDYLRGLGCRVINYHRRHLGDELDSAHPEGVDVVWETMGGDTFDTLFSKLRPRGRLVVVGAMQGYLQGKQPFPDAALQNLPYRLFARSTTLAGFLLSDYAHLHREYFGKLYRMLQDRSLFPMIDVGLNAGGSELRGVEGCIRGVEYLHSGKSMGKVAVLFD